MAADDVVVVSRHSQRDLDIVGDKLKRCYRANDNDGAFDDLLARLDGAGVGQNASNGDLSVA
jgi:hypothetical protein